MRSLRSIIVWFVAGFAITLALLGLSAIVFKIFSTGPDVVSRGSGLHENASLPSDPSDSSLDPAIQESQLELPNTDESRGTYKYLAALDEMLFKADRQQLMLLLDRSQGVKSNFRRALLQEAIAQRLAGIDPIFALNQIQNFPSIVVDQLTHSILREWSITDFEAALDYAQKISDPRTQQDAIAAIFGSRDDLSNRAIRQISGRLGLSKQLSTAILSSTRRTSASSDFRANFVNQAESLWFGSSAEYDLLSRTLREWVDTDGELAIRRLYDSSLDWGIKTPQLKQGILYLAESDPVGAFETALDLFVDSDWSSIELAARAWSERDPWKAIEGISRLVDSSVLKNKLLEVVTSNFARLQPREILENIQAFPNEHQITALHSAIAVLPAITKTEASHLLSSVSTEHRNTISQSLVMSWGPKDFSGAFDWILANPDLSELRNLLLTVVMRNFELNHAESAFERALRHPIGESKIGLEASIIGNIAHLDIDLATSMLSDVRDEKTRVAARSYIGYAHLRSQRYNEALKLASEVSEENRPDFYSTLMKDWVALDFDSALASLDRIESPTDKSRASVYVIRQGRILGLLSNRELKELEEHLTAEDKTLLDSIAPTR